MMSEMYAKVNDEARILDFEQFSMWTDVPEAPGKRAILRFGERNGAPRLSVMANIETSPKNVYVAMDPSTWYHFLECFEKVCRGENGCKMRIDNLSRGKEEDGSRGMRIVRNSLWFGKDENGVCWLSVDQANFPRIRFKFLSSAWHYFYRADGSKLTPEECSCSQTLGMIEALRHAYGPYIGRLRLPYGGEKGDRGEKLEKIVKKEVVTSTVPKSIDVYMDDDIPY